MDDVLRFHLPDAEARTTLEEALREELGAPAEAVPPTLDATEPNRTLELQVAQLLLTLPIAILAGINLAERLKLVPALKRVIARLRDSGIRISQGGAVVPIENMDLPKLLADAAQVTAPPPAWDVVLLYASPDQAAVEAFHAALIAYGMRVFWDRATLPLGASRSFARHNALRTARATLLMLSPEWHTDPSFQDDIQQAMARRDRDSHPVLPVWLTGVPLLTGTPPGLDDIQELDVVAVGGLGPAAKEVAVWSRGLER